MFRSAIQKTTKIHINSKKLWIIKFLCNSRAEACAFNAQTNAAQKINFAIRISSVTKSVRKLRILSYLLKKSLLEIFIICAVKLKYLHPRSSLFSTTEYITYRFIRIAIGYYCSMHHVYFKTSCYLQIMFCLNFLKS